MPPPFLGAMNASVSMVHAGLGNALGVFQNLQGVVNAGGGVEASVIAPRLTEALQASEALPGLVAPDDAAKIRALIQSGNHLEALQRLTAYHAVLELAHQECTEGMPAAAKLPLERIAGLFGIARHEFAAPLDGRPLEGNRPVSAALPLTPMAAPQCDIANDAAGFRPCVLEKLAVVGHEWGVSLGRDPACGVVFTDTRVSQRHAVLSFSNGRYWIADQGSTNGTHVNGERLRPHERREVRATDAVHLGPYPVGLRFPYQLRLAELAGMMENAPTFRAVFAILKNKGFEDVVPKIEAIVKSPVSLNERLAALRREVPYDGGLLLKLEALLLRGEVVRLRSLYFRDQTPAQALETGLRLTASLAQSRSFADLADRIRGTNPEGFQSLLEILERFQKGRAPFSELPETFGLREQAQRLFLEGLSVDAEQRQDLQWAGVTADLLSERPWKKIDVSPLLQKHLDPFQNAIGRRLNRAEWKQLEKTIIGAFADERDEPQVVDDAEPVKYGGTMHILYDKYQGQSPVTETTGTLTESHTESKKPGFFDKILNGLANDRLLSGYNGYWFFGGAPNGKPRFEGRIYLSLRRRHADAIFRYLAKDVQGAVTAAGGKIQFKIAGVPEGYSRSDAGVIYFHAKDQTTILKAIQKMSQAHPEFFKPGEPLFTMPLMEGLSFGEHPLYESVSFGQLRTDAMTTAVRAARALMGTAEPPDWAEVRQMCAYFLKRAGVDIENPAFNDGGRDKFGPVLAYTTPAPTPVAPAPQASKVTHPMTHPTISLEIHQRYPALAASDVAPLVEKMATDMFARWQADKRFPGLGKTDRVSLPEDIFEAVAREVTRTMEGGNYSPRVKALLSEMKNNDQGPRVVRGVKAKLSIDLPSLNANPVGHQLAWDIYRHWKSGKDLTGEGLKRVFYSRLTGLRDYLRTNPPQMAGNARAQRLLADLERYLR